MADEKTRRRRAARVKVARFQGYKDFYLARKFGTTQEQARTIIRRIGKDRVKLIAAAKRLKNRNPSPRSATTAEEPGSRSHGGSSRSQLKPRPAPPAGLLFWLRLAVLAAPEIC